MKQQTSELIRHALNWAVAKCIGYKDKDFCPHDKYFRDEDNKWFSPADDWAQGGPIIERELVRVQPFMGKWIAYMDHTPAHADGPTPLIAAMRCYVASQLGDEVDVPEELMAV